MPLTKIKSDWVSGDLVFTQSPAGTAAIEFDTLLRMGNGASAPFINNTASTKFISCYLQSGASSGTSVGLYLREYLTVAGGSNACVRIYSDVVNNAQSTAQGIQCTLGFGESTTSGSVTGLGVAGRFQIGLANLAYPGTGTIACLQAEIYSFGSSSDSGGTAIAGLRILNDGNATGMGEVDKDAVAFDFSGWASGSTLFWYDHDGTAGGDTVGEWVKVKTPNGIKYLGLYDAVH